MATIPSPAEVLYQQEHVSENRVAALIAANAACLSLAFIFVGLRFQARRLRQTNDEADDWLVIAGLVRS